MKLRLIICGVISMALGGCMDMQQDFAFAPDGTVTAEMTLSMSASLVGLIRQNPEAGEFCSPGPEMPDVDFTFEKYAEGGDEVCKIVTSGPISQFSQFVTPSAMPGGDQETVNPPHITVQPIGENWRFLLTVTTPPAPEAQQNENPFGTSANAMVMSAFEGRAAVWTVTAPTIISTTGQLSEDRKTARFSIPLASVLSQPDRTFEFEVVFGLGSGDPLSWLWNLFR